MTDRSKAALPSGSSMQRAVMSACLWYSSNLVTIVYFAGKNQLNHKFGRLHECETDFRAPAHPVSSPLLVSLLFLFRAGVEVDLSVSDQVLSFLPSLFRNSFILLVILVRIP